MNAIVHIQNTAPGPPIAIAVPTPAMLPTPTRDAAEIVNAWKAETDCGLPSSPSGVLFVSVRNISGIRRNCTTPERTVKYRPRSPRTGSTAHVHSRSPPARITSFRMSIPRVWRRRRLSRTIHPSPGPLAAWARWRYASRVAGSQNTHGGPDRGPDDPGPRDDVGVLRSVGATLADWWRRAPSPRPHHLLPELTKRSPAQVALLIFLAAAAGFTALLSLPIAAADGRATPLHDSLFTAVSAITVTGLVTVDTATHWSFFGQVVILIGIQVGGLGIVTIALLLARVVTRQLGVRSKLFAQQSIGTSKLGEVGTLLRIVVLTTLTIELVLALVLIPRFIMVEESWSEGLWHGLFYAISSFNNAGFVLNEGGLGRFDGDPFILVPIMVGVFVGSFGFPVFLTLLNGDSTTSAGPCTPS